MITINQGEDESFKEVNFFFQRLEMCDNSGEAK